jgi:hypothetical protein
MWYIIQKLLLLLFRFHYNNIVQVTQMWYGSDTYSIPLGRDANVNVVNRYTYVCRSFLTHSTSSYNLFSIFPTLKLCPNGHYYLFNAIG